MKTRSKFIPMLMIGSALFAMTLVSGCKKDQTTTEDFTTSAEEIGQAESIHSDVDNMVSQAAQTGTFDQRLSAPANGQNDQFGFSTCATVIRDTVNHVVTIDFGSGCVGQDGRTRSGRIITNYSGGGYFDPGATWTTTFDSFYVESKHIEGTRTVLNNGLNGSNNMTWTITGTNMKITKANGNWRTWNTQRTREMTAGYGNNIWIDDVYLINGTASGTTSSGESCTATLTNLVRDHACHFITSGTIVIVPSNKPSRTIDFGNGTCDNQATVTLNGVTHTIYLHH